MCAGAILQARIDTLVWGAPNKLLGADGSWIRYANTCRCVISSPFTLLLHLYILLVSYIEVDWPRTLCYAAVIV